MIESVDRLALNMHPSMLPAYRGADPIGRQIACGEPRPGVSLHLLSQRFDAGDILAQSTLGLSAAGAGREALEYRCAKIGCDLFVEVLDGYDSSWRPIPQQQLAGTGIPR